MAPRLALLYENMSRELTNLLPKERRSALAREYYLRLTTVATVLLALLLIVSALLLLPTYIYLKGQVARSTEVLTRINTSLAASGQEEAGARLATLEADSRYLLSVAGSASASGALQALISVSRPGITLTGFTFTPGVKGAEGRMLVTGYAATREALRAYDAALEAQPYVSVSELPISAYALESDIPFTITLTGSFLP